MDISKRLKELREIHKLTQEELAQGLNVSRTTISNYENGSRTPDISMINNIADFYNITINSIFSDTIEYKSKHKSRNLKYKIISIVSILFSLVIIIISNVVTKEHDYGYDIYDDELKVNNSEVISVVEVLEKVDNNTYKVNFINSLKGPSFSYLSIKNKEIEVKYDTCYLVFGNLIKDNEEYKNYISIDCVEVYDYLFFYELDDYNKSILTSEQENDVSSIIEYYSYYINKEKPKNIEYAYLLNPRTEEYKIDNKDCFSNPYDSFNLVNDFNKNYLQLEADGYKYIDIEITMKISDFKANKGNIYLYKNNTSNIEDEITSLNFNYKILNAYKHDIVSFNFTNIDISKLFVNNNYKIDIRYDYEGNNSSYWTNKDIDIKIGYKM